MTDSERQRDGACIRALIASNIAPMLSDTAPRPRRARRLTLLGVVTLTALTTGGTALAGPPPLGPGRLTELQGTAYRIDAAGTRAALSSGDEVAPGERVLTTDAATRLELTFADGSLVRLGPSSEIALVGERRVELRAGRVLAHSDLMRGGVHVDTAALRLVPQGTTYIVELSAAGEVDLTVLEGVVRAERRPGRASAGDGARDAAPLGVVCPGETLHLEGHVAGRLGLKQILSMLADDALLAATKPLDSLKRIRALGDQQRRGVLSARNDRLRNELLWSRPVERSATVVKLSAD